MDKLTSRERFKRMFEHKDADRVPILGAPWGDTLERWRRKGMSKDVDFAEYFGLDRIDSIFWCHDMGYCNGTFFSVDMYREILKPVQKRAIDWAHSKGIVAHLHSCGNINAFVQELIEIGLDALNPLEVKAGMDPVHLKRTYGNDLVLHGGVNAMLWDDIDRVEEEIARLLPILKQNGGYIFQEDHSIPDSVSFDNFRRIIALVKELGAC